MSDRETFPRPEYPRPDFQRGTVEGRDWLNLNGPWQFRFDPGKNGYEKGWHLPGDVDWREQIIVPFCWESLAAWGEADTAGNDNYYSTRPYRNPLEVTRANHSYVARYEMGWYRRRIRIPSGPPWKDRRVILKVGAADFFTDCWCNGFHVGRHEGGYTPFEFDLTDAIRRGRDRGGEALLVLRVEDPMDNHEQPVGKQWHWYTPTSGIWQTVYVEPRDPAHIAAFRIVSDIDKKTVSFEVECANAEEGSQVMIYVIPPGGEVKVHKAAVKSGRAHRTIEVPAPYLWSPNDPKLYKTAFKLQNAGRTQDYVQSYFGMRKVDSGPAEDPKAPAVLRLNNVPRYLRGALYQSYHPEGVYTAPDAERLREDILQAKRLGFNFLRVHIKLDDPLLLYYADALGMLLMADFPNFGEGGNTPSGRRRFEEMVRAGIRRDFNHPSIFAWCVFNETWGFGGQAEFVKVFPAAKEKITRKFHAGTSSPLPQEPVPPEAAPKVRLDNLEAHGWVQQVWHLAKTLDPTRLIEDMSVVHWEHLEFYAHGETDINSWHFYINDYQRAKTHIQKIVDSTFAGSKFNYVPGFEQKSQPLINSEYGGIGALDGNRDCSWSFKFLTNELRRHASISAYIYTELHDVEWEYNGLLAYDRTPKEFGFDPRWLNESDVLPMDFPPLSRHAPGSELRIDVSSSHYSSAARHNVFLRWRLTGIDTWGRFHRELSGGMVRIGFPHRRVAPAHSIGLRLPEHPMLCCLTVEALEENGAWIAGNFVHLWAAAERLPRVERSDRSCLLRAFPHEWSRAQWSGPSSSREEAGAGSACHGAGHGFFEWEIPVEGADLSQAQRIRFLCEASARTPDTAQTSLDRHPTALHADLNGMPIVRQTLPDHPHDSRGVLSYLRGDQEGRGGYGYLVSAVLEHEMLREAVGRIEDGKFRLRLSSPAEQAAPGGLTVYGAEAGRYPFPPQILIEG